KMIGWGAPVPKEDKGRLLDYLVRHFGTEVPPVPPARLAPEVALAPPPGPAQKAPPGDPTRGARFYKAACANCHGGDAPGGDLRTNLGGGPILLDLAAYTDVVRNGRRRMPASKALLDPQGEADILAWLKQQKYDPKLAHGPTATK